MEPNINRAQTFCWFEKQPGGCRKPHCVFAHSQPRPSPSAVLEISNVASKTPAKVSSDLILPVKSINSGNSQIDGETKTSDETPYFTALKTDGINILIEKEDESDDQDDVQFDESDGLLEKISSTSQDGERVIKTLEQIKMEKLFQNSSHEEPFRQTASEKLYNLNSHQSISNIFSANKSKNIDARSLLTRHLRNDHNTVVKILPNPHLGDDKVDQIYPKKSLPGNDRIAKFQQTKRQRKETSPTPKEVVKTFHHSPQERLNKEKQTIRLNSEFDVNGNSPSVQLKENKIPNLSDRLGSTHLKRSHESESLANVIHVEENAPSAKPVKIRRSKIIVSSKTSSSRENDPSTSSNKHCLQPGPISDDHSKDSDTSKHASFHSTDVLATNIDDDLDFLNIDGQDVSTGHQDLDEDELMREIDQVINS